MRVTVLGGGAAAQATLVDLASRGIKVKWGQVTTYAKHILEVQKKGGLHYYDHEKDASKLEFINLLYAGTDIKTALKDSEAIIISTRTSRHLVYCCEIIQNVTDHKIVIFSPGHCGPLIFRRVMESKAKKMVGKFILSEISTLPYIARCDESGHIHIYRRKRKISASCLPTSNSDRMLHYLSQLYPNIELGEDVLFDSLSGVGIILHPLSTLFNASNIEHGSPIRYSNYGFTPSISRLCEKADSERNKLFECLNYPKMSLSDWIASFYDVKLFSSLYETLSNSNQYAELSYTDSLNSRFVEEDIPFGLTILYFLGMQYKVNMPLIESIIKIFSIMNKKNYFKGYSLSDLGIDKLSIQQLKNFLKKGKA